ncbi:hypothetical protein PF006_g32987, partial [Phytophthora fragariae]
SGRLSEALSKRWQQRERRDGALELVLLRPGVGRISVLSGFSMRGREKVMYHIDVVDHDAPVQTYIIRRSYSDFKDLHS